MTGKSMFLKTKTICKGRWVFTLWIINIVSRFEPEREATSACDRYEVPAIGSWRPQPKSSSKKQGQKLGCTLHTLHWCSQESMTQSCSIRMFQFQSKHHLVVSNFIKDHLGGKWMEMFWSDFIYIYIHMYIYQSIACLHHLVSSWVAHPTTPASLHSQVQLGREKNYHCFRQCPWGSRSWQKGVSWGDSYIY